MDDKKNIDSRDGAAGDALGDAGRKHDGERKETGPAGGESKPGNTFREEAIDLAKTVAWAVAIALVLRIIIFQPFNIPSGSMKPNLLVGDFLFVSKPAYGYSRASLVWPLTRLDIHGRILAHEPKRGDVLVFKNRKDGNKDYIKRLIGMPGDEIQMRGGRLHINGAPVQKEFVEYRLASCDGMAAKQVPTFRETLPNGVNYIVQECHGDRGHLDDTAVYKVPAGRYFMMGDNRDQSEDSRVTARVGYVPFEDIVGRAERLFLSVDGQRFAIRFGRILKKIE
ncbi:MAG: signal peptidase I [Alphaproteobacteria bacterium]|nr:signal peptidase I [Alphaproteobacteria bacterium]